MTTFKISVYENGTFIRDIWADFSNKKSALSWTLEQYSSIGINLNPKEVVIINPLA